jgi:hypothetical protein
MCRGPFSLSPARRSNGDDTHERLVARNNLLLVQQSGDSDKIEAAVSAMLAAGYKAPYIKSTLQGEQGDQRMFKQLPKSDQMSLLNQATPAEFDRYLPRYAKKRRSHNGTRNIRRLSERNERSAGKSRRFDAMANSSPDSPPEKRGALAWAGESLSCATGRH